MKYFQSKQIISEFDYYNDEAFYFKKYKNEPRLFSGRVVVISTGDRGPILTEKFDNRNKTFDFTLTVPDCNTASVGTLPILRSPAILGMGINSSVGCTIRKGGNLYCWKYYKFFPAYMVSIMINGAFDNHVTPIMISPVLFDHDDGVCALFSNHTLGCWEFDWHAANFKPIDFGSGKYAMSAAMIHGKICVILKNNDLKCWFLDDPKSSEKLISFGAEKFAVSVFMGGDHICAILNDKSLTCWGANDRGQVGDSSTEYRHAPTTINVGNGSDRYPIQVSLGWDHSCAILNDLTLNCWGSNNLGQLGDSTMEDRLVPTEVNLGKNRRALAVASGYKVTCAILDDYSLECWGLNFSLGKNNTIKPLKVSISFGKNKTVKPLKVSIGRYEICALMHDKSLYCDMRNYYDSLLIR